MSSLPCWQQRMFAAPLAGPKYLFSLQHEEVYFNEATFGCLAFHLSKRWPYAALLCGGDLWHCRHSRCLSVFGDVASAGSAQPVALHGVGPGAAQKDPLEPALIRAGLWLYLGRKGLHFSCFSCKTLPHQSPEQAVVMRSVVFGITHVRL